MLLARRLFLTTVCPLLALGLRAPPAHADQGAGANAEEKCLSAEVEGQKLQRKGRLLDARTRFEACSRASCPTEVIDYCAKWLVDVRALIPSVIVVVRDARGRDVPEARVFVDNGLAAGAGTGSAIELDPGKHAFRFEQPLGASVSQEILIREGDKARRLIVTLPNAVTPPARPPPSAAVYVLGALGVVGAGVFAYAGLRGLSDRSSFGCGTPAGCTGSHFDQVKTEYIVADIGLGVAIASFAAAAVLYFTRRPVERIEGAPVIGRAGGLIQF